MADKRRYYISVATWLLVGLCGVINAPFWPRASIIMLVILGLFQERICYTLSKACKILLATTQTQGAMVQLMEIPFAPPPALHLVHAGWATINPDGEVWPTNVRSEEPPPTGLGIRSVAMYVMKNDIE